MTGIQATGDDTWDDSELLASYDGLREEYDKYHSINARSEKVPTDPVKPQTYPEILSSFDGKSNRSGAVANGTSVIDHPTSEQAFYGTSTDASQSKPSVPLVPPMPPMTDATSFPQSVLASQQDPNVKNLMMAWYYAGYYTGLYEGKQAAWAEMQGDSRT